MKLNFRLNKIGIIPVLFLLVTSLSLTSCYPDYGLSSSDHDVIVTQYAKSTDFSQYKTFAIIDSVFHLTGDSLDSEYLSRKYDNLIINTITDNMKALGYDQVLNPESPDSVDVVLYVAAQGSKVDQYYYGGWWGYYPGYPYWGWGGGYSSSYYWGYPGYPGYVGTTTYYVGTIFINYVNTDSFGEETVDVEWHAILNGLLNSDSYTVTENRLADRINKAFEQSPYLQVSN